MIYINLLPWREDKLAYKKRLSEIFLITVASMVICIFLISHYWLKQTNLYLTNQLTQLESTLNEYKQLKTNRSMLKQDNARQPNASLAFANQILLPGEDAQQICFKEIAYAGNVVRFTGLTKSAQSLTEFLLSWKHAQWFTQMQIESMQQVNEFVGFQFHGELKK